MLRVSTRGEYGVRIMVDLARHYGGRPRSLTDISQAETRQMPLAYLEQLVKLLREADPPLVVSTRGAHGGYRLSRDPTKITMGEVVRILEGPISPMICATEGEMTEICGNLDSCRTQYLWIRVRDAIAQTLDSITLADLVAAETLLEKQRGTSSLSPTTQFIALADIQVGINSADGSKYKQPETPVQGI